jgi:predicted nucleic acid-binding protein
MSRRKRLVLDANILLSAVLGFRVRFLLARYEDEVDFFAPEVCFGDALKYIPDIAVKRKSDLHVALDSLEQIADIVESVDQKLYGEYEVEARMRIVARDVNDWPIVAAALLLDCPIWTEDQDFFGCGVTTWTTNNVELYLRDPPAL